MIKINNTSQDPYFNMALDEYATKNFLKGTVFYFYQNKPTVVIGRHQNAFEEVNLDFVRERGIEVVRRISGGGAVYHDLGNLNFTFIADAGSYTSFDFVKFTRPVIKALAKIGIKAEHTGRNDITIAGKKFSGNAQYRYKNRVMHHGTILFAVNIEDMVQALNVDPDKIVSKGVKSVRSRVTNISEHLTSPLSLEEFKEILTATILEEEDFNQEYALTEEDLRAINELRDKKFKTWEWIYGTSPHFNVQKKMRFDWGSLDIRLDVEKGIIKGCKIYGDFFAARDIEELERLLTGTRYEEEDIKAKLEAVKVADYLPAATAEDILKVLF
ncbi:lipoate-protein ligase [Thermosyntropha lipolytica DSM 11003]|uniref:lipoate--protein ligase n=1 Tax=Thermosyntropha lipolytica DSM 11003 TaxID=1123382 RepID=A0A1M5MTS6_9FIRM|nr:lipoate--protein ligase [Thermosyntropha lipolytica]SHG80688.1 lipoate-protein ligase [Thermosyntropha lipolytica DSM 11003]